MKKTPRGKHQIMWNKLMNVIGLIVICLISVAFLQLMVLISIHCDKSSLGIYKIEREIQKIHQRLDQKAPVDNNEAQNGEKWPEIE